MGIRHKLSQHINVFSQNNIYKILTWQLNNSLETYFSCNKTLPHSLTFLNVQNVRPVITLNILYDFIRLYIYIFYTHSLKVRY